MRLTADVVERLRGHRVLVVGDVMVDEYVRGEVARISPEAPVPVLEVRGSERRLGGAANTAANIARLGGSVALVGVVGDDAEAAALRADLERIGIAAHLCTDAGRPTTRKTRFVAQQQQIVRIDHESRAAVAGPIARAVTDAIRAEVATAAAVVLSDYAKGMVTAETAQAVTAAARERGVPVVVDPKQHDFGIYRGATVITPNLVELERAAAAPTGTPAQIEHAVRRIAAAIGDTDLLVTRGADGMTLYRAAATSSPYHVPAATREVFDVTGAGDTVVATVALALAAGLSLEIAVELASLAAGISVSKRGTSTVEPAELAAAISPGGRAP